MILNLKNLTPHLLKLMLLLGPAWRHIVVPTTRFLSILSTTGNMQSKNLSLLNELNFITMDFQQAKHNKLDQILPPPPLHTTINI